MGGAQGAFEAALKYSRQREQFGKPISTFQANAFKLADCAMYIECARLLLYKSCWLRDHDKPFAKEAAMAKLYCSEVMYTVANHAVAASRRVRTDEGIRRGNASIATRNC